MLLVYEWCRYWIEKYGYRHPSLKKIELLCVKLVYSKKLNLSKLSLVGGRWYKEALDFENFNLHFYEQIKINGLYS